MKVLPRLLAAHLTVAAACTAHATGFPVIDAANVTQTAVSAIENVSQTLKQVEAYVLQLQQYEDQIRNTLAPAAFVWDKANQTMNQVLGTIDTLNYYRHTAGSLENYLNRFQNANYYRQSPCFGPKGCSEAEKAKLEESDWEGSIAQKRANDALLRGLEQQQAQLDTDSRNLERLQSQAQSAQGRMEAIQYANQLASHQAAQLLQLRTLLVQQQAAEAARAQAVADREAKAQAAHAQSTAADIQPGQDTGW